MGCNFGTQGQTADKTAASGVKIYGVSISPNAMPAVMMVVEMNVGSLVQVDLTKGDQMKPEFLEMNPFHHVPTMNDGILNIGEGSAILRYLAMKYNKEAYPGSQDVDKSAFIDFALTSALTEVYPKFSKVVYPVMGFAPAVEDFSGPTEELSKAIETWLEHFVKGTDFVKGSKPTIADYGVIAYLFAAMQPVIAEKTGFKPSERHVQYVENFSKAVKSSSLLSDGDNSIKAFIASKST
eukprot:CAMPEP_0194507218 /NCGR_PEP_ID=MMETSP0253-20130528/36439_1 /TAXON_ID=2966 /ORGANISM="Noctiluca scintillans" /LENGTH=237 /DNA_ID=CAMNT_0039350075 /DNA_START=63 /DNA_END=776 /DNA_ORIENTATION=+